jgi:hypothetical protein
MAARAELAGTAFIPIATRADRQGESASRRCLREDRTPALLSARRRIRSPGGLDGAETRRRQYPLAAGRSRADHRAAAAAGRACLPPMRATSGNRSPKLALAALLPPGRHPLPRKSCASIAARDSIKRMFEPDRSGGLCSFHGCGRPGRTKGFCGGHHQQHRKGWALRPLRPHYGRPRTVRVLDLYRPDLLAKPTEEDVAANATEPTSDLGSAVGGDDAP